jgi:hypothetical protein
VDRTVERLEERGVLIGPRERTGELDVVRRRQGALARFLEDREE